MKPGKLKSFRVQLVEMRRSLEEMTSSLAEAGKTVELDQTSVGRLSRMDAMQGQQMALEAERRRRQKLLAVDAALKRLDGGNFGECLVCGEEINPLRLEADPTNTRCIDCAAKG